MLTQTAYFDTNNRSIYDWMKKRNSEGNFIYGEYGDFNILFPTLVRKLSALPNETFKTVEIWKNSFLFDTISLSKRISLGLYDELLQKSKEFCCNFFEKINLENFIITDVVNVLHDFLDSINSGFMLLGASGSGKTTLLGYLIKNLQNTSNFVILPFSGREQRLLQRGINVFSNWFSDFEKLEVINKLFLCREQTLVLVYDALNEMPGNFNFLQDNYNGLIKFTEMLSQKEYRNIKIILSLRTDSYLQLRQNEALEPRPGVFYTPLAENRTIFPLYQLPVFSESQTLELLQKETSLNRQILKKLYHEFSSILQTPFYIQLFGQILCSFSDLGEKEFAIFSLKWYDTIFNNIAKDEVIQNELSNVTEAIILVKYQYEGRKVFINDIVRKMHIAKEKLEKDILKLQSSGILAYEKTTGQINFSHESYEQIFLTKYLTQIDNPENFCASIYEKQKSPTILTLSLLDYLRIQKYFNSENYLNILLRFLTRDSRYGTNLSCNLIFRSPLRFLTFSISYYHFTRIFSEILQTKRQTYSISYFLKNKKYSLSVHPISCTRISYLVLW